MSIKTDKLLVEEINSYIQKRIPDIAHSIAEARVPRSTSGRIEYGAKELLTRASKLGYMGLNPIKDRAAAIGRNIGYGATQLGSLSKEVGYKVRRDLEKSASSLRTDLQQIVDTNLTKDENILLKKHGLDPDYVRDALKTYPSHNEIKIKYPTPPKRRSEREKYESLLNLANERREVENTLTHIKFMNPQFSRLTKSKQDYEMGYLRNIANLKAISGKIDIFSKKIQDEKRKRELRSQAFDISQARQKVMDTDKHQQVIKDLGQKIQKIKNIRKNIQDS